MFSWASAKRSPVIVAHRGASRVAPENTLAAFRQAIREGADAIELDVRLSCDGEVVVIHDARLERTTNGHGKVKDATLGELKKLSAGSWFHQKYAGEGIPTLNEVFQLTKNRIGINVEIKEPIFRRSRTDIVKKCLKVIENSNGAKSVLISSFNHSIVKRVKALWPEIMTGVLYHPVRHFRRTPERLARGAGAEMFICGTRSFRARMAPALHEAGIRVGVYTVNNAVGLRKMLNSSVDVVYTDRIGEIKKLLRKGL